MTTFVTIIYVIVAFMMVLAILLQAGKGGGLGSALGGGASQGVFGGGGGGDFMAKLTQGMAATFMICAMYLAYASAHAGSEFLEGEDTGSTGLLSADAEIDYEFIGPNPQKLPSPEEGKAKQEAAAALVPAVSELPSDGTPADLAPTDEAPAPTDDDAPAPADADPAPSDTASAAPAADEGADKNNADSQANGTAPDPEGKDPSDDE